VKSYRNLSVVLSVAIAIALLAMPVAADTLPDPDGKPADMSKPVQVFIIMGQSNTLEMGKVQGGEGSLEHAVKTENLYPFMVDDAGNWTTRKDVRNVHVAGSGGPGKARVMRNDWLTVSGGKIGIETGIGHQLGNAIDAPVWLRPEPGQVGEGYRTQTHWLEGRRPIRRRCRSRQGCAQ
jgi:hypothetical protein